MTERTLIEAEITFLPKSEGGRDILGKIFQDSQYRPHIVINNPRQLNVSVADKDYLGVAFVDGPQLVEFGLPVKTTMLLTYWPRVDYSAVLPESTFTLREGGRTIAFGRVKKRWTEQ